MSALVVVAWVAGGWLALAFLLTALWSRAGVVLRRRASNEATSAEHFAQVAVPDTVRQSGIGVFPTLDASVALPVDFFVGYAGGRS